MRTALVTGASRGIGKAIADKLEATGHDVIRWSSKNYDFTDPAEMQEAAATLIGKDIDILVNNAGKQIFGYHSSLPVDFGLMMLMPAMLSDIVRRRMSIKGWGRIVNISSIAAIAGGRNCIGYDVAKAALNRLTKALAVEWAAEGITVNAIMPGFIDTDMLAPLKTDEAHAAEVMGRIPAGRFGKPEEVAALACWLCSDEAAYVNGAIIPVDGGWLCR